jgi:hypothetical protein
MITEQDFNAKHHELYQLMSDISEDCYCAGWITENEYGIWAALQTGDRTYGMSEMNPDQLKRCGELAQELDGWIIWLDDYTDPTLPSEKLGPRFVSMGAWLDICLSRGMSEADLKDPTRTIKPV